MRQSKTKVEMSKKIRLEKFKYWIDKIFYLNFLIDNIQTKRKC